MNQMTLASQEFELYAQNTRHAGFLTEMACVISSNELCALIRTHDPTTFRELKAL